MSGKASIAALIAPLHDDQVDAAVRILTMCGWSGDGLPSAATLKQAGKDGAAFVALTSDSRAPVGMIRVLTDGVYVTYVTELAVLAGYREQGIGDALLDAVRKAFPTTRVDLLSSDMATGFYESCGFHAKPGYRRWPA